MQIVTYDKYESADPQIKVESVSSISNEAFNLLVQEVISRIQKFPESNRINLALIQNELGLFGPGKLKSFNNLQPKSAKICHYSPYNLRSEEFFRSDVENNRSLNQDSYSYFIQISPPIENINIIKNAIDQRKSKKRKLAQVRKVRELDKAKRLLVKEGLLKNSK